MVDKHKNVVLGGGIAGIAAGYFANQNGEHAVVFEALESAGGLLDCFYVEDFRFDNAVHFSFATEPEVRKIFDQTPYHTLHADAWCWDQGQWLRHPVQNNLFPLSVEEKVMLISGLVNRPNLEIKTYADWLLYQYGAPIAERWPFRYTKKYWTVPPEELSVNWIGNRMRRSDIKEVLYGSMSANSPHTYYLNEVRYPIKGGYRAFLEPMLPKCDIRCGHRVVAIDLDNKIVRFANGHCVQYQCLVSTLPLPLLPSLIVQMPDTIKGAAESLFATIVDLISIGFGRPNVSKYPWIYIYDMDILAARAYSPSLQSSNNAPEGCSSIQFEIYSSPKNPQKASPAEMIENSLLAIERLGLATRDDVRFVHHKRLPYGNVVFDIGMERRRDLVLDWLRAHGIVTAGRFGNWGYLWSHQSLLSGLRAARSFNKSGEAELNDVAG
jgi:protoporphyrinogen oxidase